MFLGDISAENEGKQLRSKKKQLFFPFYFNLKLYMFYPQVYQALILCFRF